VTLPSKKPMMHQAFVSVGSNLGDKIENCQKGINGLLADGRSVLVRSSSFYRTSPVDYEDQDWFVNLVVKIKTTLNPFDLLDKLRDIEKEVGRKTSTVRFGPRVLDLDIIFYDDQVIQTHTLEIPHPRMHKRRFVLKPICDIEPSMMHPLLGKDMRSLLDGLRDSDQRVMEIQ
jgi:2-amino-4-hydroxy-6-hydroxymethyldihydropteridine diphosphokinase